MIDLLWLCNIQLQSTTRIRFQIFLSHTIISISKLGSGFDSFLMTPRQFFPNTGSSSYGYFSFIQLVSEKFFEFLFSSEGRLEPKIFARRNSKNSSRPLAPKVLLGHLSRGEHSSENVLGHLGVRDCRGGYQGVLRGAQHPQCATRGC